MTKDEALRIALEALGSGIKTQFGRLDWIEYDIELVEQAITAIKAALEAKDEPVAWAWRAFDPDEGHDGKWGYWHISDYKPPRQQSRWFQVVPLPSTTPPQQEAKDEPVAWLHRFIEGGISIGLKPSDLERHPERWEPLYTEPKPCPTCEALARTVMLDQTSHDTNPLQRGI